MLMVERFTPRAKSVKARPLRWRFLSPPEAQFKSMIVHADKVMLVEDDLETRTFLGQILELEGFEVVTFSNGLQALDYLAQSAPPCLIILDLRMPIMDGPQFRAAMLADPRFALIPVIVVTAFEPSSAAALSALRVFRKPLDVTALLGVIRKNC